MKTPKLYKYAIMHSTTEDDGVTTTATSSSPSGTTAGATNATSKKNYLPWILAAGVGCLLIFGSTRNKKKRK